MLTDIQSQFFNFKNYLKTIGIDYQAQLLMVAEKEAMEQIKNYFLQFLINEKA